MKSEQEHKFTSTGIKFWRQERAMNNYLSKTGDSVVSTHISPEGACNLSCPYCSVTHRDTHNRIDLPVIKDYVRKLRSRGLKAVILTGGGEPTAYPKFNELCHWLTTSGLKVALITNGTLTHKVDPVLWSRFSWVRVSINFFKGWQDKIKLPPEALSACNGLVRGCSLVYTPKHELGDTDDWAGRFKDVSEVADKCGAEYIRVLPNCLLPQDELSAAHAALDYSLKSTGDHRFFRQDKNHRAPSCSSCHQSYFRPYLSEESFGETGTPGAVYPCDSLVLNDARAKFTEDYQLCAPGNILDYLDGKIEQRFDAKNCSGCVFTDNVEMLDKWRADGVGDFIDDPLEHEEFV